MYPDHCVLLKLFNKYTEHLLNAQYYNRNFLECSKEDYIVLVLKKFIYNFDIQMRYINET